MCIRDRCGDGVIQVCESLPAIGHGRPFSVGGRVLLHRHEGRTIETGFASQFRKHRPPPARPPAMAKRSGVDKATAARSEFPEWVEPMAATLTQERFTGVEWTFERKFDGIRLIAFKQGADVRLYSRTRNAKQLPAIAAAIAALPVQDAILDGEVEWDGQTAYHVFDVIW